MSKAVPGKPPLVVDLDGTLIRADLLCEGLFRMLRQRPWRLFLLLPSLLRGRGAFKARVAAECDLDPARLPWNDAVVAFIREQREDGRPIWLATAAARRPAEQVARHLGLFDRVFASGPADNLKGARKRDVLVAAAPDGFDYIGDSRADRALFRAARQAWTAGPAAHRLARWTARRGGRAEPLPGTHATVPFALDVLRLIRPHQWLKNLLVFLPLLAGHRWGEAGVLVDAGLAFAAFCLVASAAYVLNDLLDVEHDRQHPRKRNRPLASGAVGQPFALVLLPALLVAAGGVMLLLPPLAAGVLVGYFIVTTLYSVYLKRIALVDILTLAALYNLRILGGGAATGIVLSYWLAGFTLFLFLGLAIMKRVTEVQELGDGDSGTAAGRGYHEGDDRLLLPLGIGCSVAASVVLGLYTTSDSIIDLYSRPALLVVTVPLILIWQSHLWLATIREDMHDDPLVYAVRDRATWFVGVLAASLFLAGL